MQENKRIRFADIAYIFSIVFYLVIGLWVIIIAHQNFSHNVDFLGILIILGSVPHILFYIINRTKISYLILGLIGIAFGILFITTDIFEPDHVCMIWGCIDICRGVGEIINVAPNVKKQKEEWLEIAISVGDIVIGVLLCIHLAGGLPVHLIYFGVAFVVSGLKNSAELITKRIKNGKGNSDN